MTKCPYSGEEAEDCTDPSNDREHIQFHLDQMVLSGDIIIHEDGRFSVPPNEH